MPKGVYPHDKIRGRARPDRRTPNVCHECGVALVMGENWELGRRKLCANHWRAYYRQKNSERYHNNPDFRARMIAYATKQHLALRAEMLDAYGHCCTCCGETEASFLTIDHVGGRGEGARHREVTGHGSRLVRWLKNQGWPKEGFRLLCWNCNCAIGMYGSCPHRAQPFPTSFPWAA